METIQTSENDNPLIPLPAPELNRLDIFVGKWHAEGDSYNVHQPENLPAAIQKWVSEESYEWMAENYFLIHRWNASIGGHKFKGVEIIGYDVTREEYFTRMFDKNGDAIKYKVTVQDDTWKFAEPFTRTTIVFSNNGNAMTVKWEWRQEGGNWLPLCNRVAVRR